MSNENIDVPINTDIQSKERKSFKIITQTYAKMSEKRVTT